MKKSSLLVFSAVLLAIAACTKENTSDVSFAGIEVEVGENNGGFSKLYVLNEGSFPGISTLDLLDFKNKKYYANIFAQANPEIVQGIGNLGNDLAVVGDCLWVLLNTSNMVAVLHLPDAKLERFLQVDSPRFITVEGNYAYITSYGAAVNGGYFMVPGKVYRIHKDSYEMSTVEVGYQPEGLAVLDGKLYVANSGGYNLEPDNRISVIDLETFKLEKHIEAPMRNLFQMAATKDRIWVSSYAEYNTDWTQVTAPQSLASVKADGTVKKLDGVHVNKMALSGKTLYCVGNNEEMTGGYDICLYKVNTETGVFQKTHFAECDLSRIGYAHGLLVNPNNGDLYICDADFTVGGISKLHCFDKNLKHKWTVDSGVGTGHLLLQ